MQIQREDGFWVSLLWLTWKKETPKTNTSCWSLLTLGNQMEENLKWYVLLERLGGGSTRSLSLARRRTAGTPVSSVCSGPELLVTYPGTLRTSHAVQRASGNKSKTNAMEKFCGWIASFLSLHYQTHGIHCTILTLCMMLPLCEVLALSL